MNSETDHRRADLDCRRRILEGDEQAFAELVGRYQATLIRLALMYVPSPAVAQEVAQETWLGVLAGLQAFEGRSALKTWIFQILTNRAKTQGVREVRSIPFSALERAEPAVDPSRFAETGMWSRPVERWSEDTPEKLMMDHDAVACVEAAIDRLPAHQRAVIVLRDVEGLDSTEVCNVLEISETNQRVLLHRARAKIRSALEQFLGDDGC